MKWYLLDRKDNIGYNCYYVETGKHHMIFDSISRRLAKKAFQVDLDTSRVESLDQISQIFISYVDTNRFGEFIRLMKLCPNAKVYITEYIKNLWNQQDILEEDKELFRRIHIVKDLETITLDQYKITYYSIGSETNEKAILLTTPKESILYTGDYSLEQLVDLTSINPNVTSLLSDLSNGDHEIKNKYYRSRLLLDPAKEIDILEQMCITLENSNFRKGRIVARNMSHLMKSILHAYNKVDFADPIIKALQTTNSLEFKIRLYYLARKIGKTWQQEHLDQLALLCMNQLKMVLEGKKCIGAEVNVNKQAINTLGKYGSKEQIEQLKELSLDPEYKENYIYALSKINTLN